MSEHPINSLMHTAIENIRDMLDVNTIIGDPIETANGTCVIPICEVSCGFVSGGSEYGHCSPPWKEEERPVLPFGGGSGAGVGISPIGFLIINENYTKFIPVENANNIMDIITEVTPKIAEKMQGFFTKQNDA